MPPQALTTAVTAASSPLGRQWSLPRCLHAQPAHPTIHRHPGVVLGVVPRHFGKGVPV